MFPTLFKFTGVAYKKDLVFWYFFSKKFSSHVGCPPSGTKEGLNMCSKMFIIFNLGLFLGHLSEKGDQGL